jgi:hypothetical protein
MSPVWIAFWVGAFLGGMGGILAMALCVAAKRGDDLPDYCHCDHANQGRACRECINEGNM